jgi:hypothetical protein
MSGQSRRRRRDGWRRISDPIDPSRYDRSPCRARTHGDRRRS